MTMLLVLVAREECELDLQGLRPVGQRLKKVRSKFVGGGCLIISGTNLSESRSHVKKIVNLKPTGGISGDGRMSTLKLLAV